LSFRGVIVKIFLFEVDMFKPQVFGKNTNNTRGGFNMKNIISKLLLILFFTFTFSCHTAIAQDIVDNVNTIKIATANYNKGKINIYYPLITGLKDKKLENRVNSTLKSKAFAFTSSLDTTASYYADYKIKYNKNNILSIVFYQDIYHPGAAHNYNQINSITLNLSNGNTYTLKDLFITNKNYESDIENILNKQASERMSQEKLYLLSNEGIQVKKDQFYLTDQYVVMYYNPYEIAPFSEGIVEFNINTILPSSTYTTKVPRNIDITSLPKIFNLTQRDVQKLYGTPDDKGTFEGAYYESYNNDNITFFFELSNTENSKLISLGLTEDYTILDTQAGMSADQVKNILGKPLWEDESYEDGIYYIYYSLQGYDVIYALDDTYTNIEFIQIKPTN
jgi:hypothetical protein